MDSRITVEYVSSDDVADPRGLACWVQSNIEEHLKSIHDVVTKDVNLKIEIKGCVVKPNYGSVALKLVGSVNGKTVDGMFFTSDTPSKPTSLRDRGDRQVKTAFANLATFTQRMIFPPEVARHIGHRRISGRAIRALEDCLADIRICIDEALERPESGASELWRSAKRRSILFGLLSFVIAVVVFLLRRTHLNDEFRGVTSCLFIPIGIWGMHCAWRLVTLPNRFYLSEAAGRKLVELIGVKSPRAIRVVAIGLCILSACIAAAGVYWLVFE